MEVIPVRVPSEITAGDDLAGIICGSAAIRGGDVVVVAQKAVSKSEGRMVRLDTVSPSLLARGISGEYGKDPRVVELVLAEASRIVRMENGVIITETASGHVCANSGVDQSNVPDGYALLLPEDSDRSAGSLRTAIRERTGASVGVVVSDTAGRPFRVGQTDIALGCSGILPLLDYSGTPDRHGRVLRATVIAVADQLAGAAEMAMKKIEGIPAAIIRGSGAAAGEGSARDIIRTAGNLFR